MNMGGADETLKRIIRALGIYDVVVLTVLNRVIEQATVGLAGESRSDEISHGCLELETGYSSLKLSSPSLLNPSTTSLFFPFHLHHVGSAQESRISQRPYRSIRE